MLRSVEYARPVRRFGIVLGLTALWHLALHLVYGGEETFLYSLHWLPLLVVIAAFGTMTRARAVARVLAAALVACATVNNQRQFTQAVNAVPHYLTIQDTTP